MAGADKTWDGESLETFQEQASNVNADHLRSACKYMIQICEGAGVEMAVLGGYSLALRGSARRTVDIDIHIKVSMRQLKELLRDKASVITPSGLAEGVYRIFVRVPSDGSDVAGDAQEEGQEGEGQVVEVDIFPVGDMVRNITTEMIEADGLNVSVFDIPSMIRNKLKMCASRGEPNDIADAIWLLDTYEADITQIRDSLDPDHCHAFLEALEGRGEDQDTVEKYRNILLGEGQNPEAQPDAGTEPEAAAEPEPEPEQEPAQEQEAEPESEA